MTIFDFDIRKGIYSFEINEVNTEIYTHPIVEIFCATSGDFSLEFYILT